MPTVGSCVDVGFQERCVVNLDEQFVCLGRVRRLSPLAFTLAAFGLEKWERDPKLLFGRLVVSAVVVDVLQLSFIYGQDAGTNHILARIEN